MGEGSRGAVIPPSSYAEMLASGLVTQATQRIRDLPEPGTGDPVSPVLEAMRSDERY